MVLPGTVTIQPEVLSELTYDIIESLNAHDLNKIILINGHRIVNVVWMQVCAQKAQSKLGCTVKILRRSIPSIRLTNMTHFVMSRVRLNTRKQQRKNPAVVRVNLLNPTLAADRSITTI